MMMQTAIAAGTTRRMPAKRARIEDDIVADYLAMLVKPGDKTLQIGGSELGTVFLQRGAFHQVIAPLAQIDQLQTQCERRSIKTDRLSQQPGKAPERDRSQIDAALVGSDLGFPAMAGNWRQIAGRMKLGGVLVLMGAGQGSAARLADALMSDEGWALQEMIAGDVAVFRKTSVSDDVVTRARLLEAGNPRRVPRGLKPGLVAGVMRTLFGTRLNARTRGLARRSR
ncbi:hypothetical protein [Maricaulis sp.]|uniref:hypothetical protein n=1 Tax=Maricaulis sp. TaxID=1486257 RepID=UPI003A919A59